jgi:uncharacterized repeat protein (TIGR03803 family)
MVGARRGATIMTNPLQPLDSFSRTSLRAICAFLLLVVAFLPVVVSAQSKRASRFATLHTFTGPDGANPMAGVIIGKGGNLYGTTYSGGATGHWGAVFEVDSTGKETVLHSFRPGIWGYYPGAGLIRDESGNLYGTTDGDYSYAGTVFRLNSAGKQKVLHQFVWSDGDGPSGLIRDEAGNLYGTTSAYGPNGYGTVFEVSASGELATLYSFTGGADGGSPIAGVIRDAAGNLYGTTEYGGDGGGGTVFKLDPTGHFSVLYSFTGGTDGGGPVGLIRDQAGNLYATTVFGGDLSCDSGYGCGTVFKLDSAGKETVLHSFTGGADGGYTRSGGSLVRDKSGNLYGTTEFGGASGGGTVFKLYTSGKLATLYSFTGGADGQTPYGLSRDAAGNLYGTTENGGDVSCKASTHGCGTVFKLHP